MMALSPGARTNDAQATQSAQDSYDRTFNSNTTALLDEAEAGNRYALTALLKRDQGGWKTTTYTTLLSLDYPCVRLVAEVNYGGQIADAWLEYAETCCGSDWVVAPKQNPYDVKRLASILLSHSTRNWGHDFTSSVTTEPVLVAAP